MPSICVPGSVLHYEVDDLTLPWIAEPQTILFHHGLGATSGTWAAWLRVLADRYRLVRFDMRGHGRSTRPEQTPPSAGGGTPAELAGRTEPVSTASPVALGAIDPREAGKIRWQRSRWAACRALPRRADGRRVRRRGCRRRSAVPPGGRVDRRHHRPACREPRGERVRTLTVSNGAHLGGSIQSIDDWQQIMDAARHGGMVRST